MNALRMNKEIEKNLKRMRREESQVHRILLLGTGESGKSTIKKQMQIIHKSGFTTEERLSHVEHIRRNIRESIITMVCSMNTLNIELENVENEESKQYMMEVPNFYNTEEFYAHTRRLWNDKGIQECYNRSSEYQLIDCAKYFLDKMDEVQKHDYIPDDQDILRCRTITTQIQQIDFTIREKNQNACFSAYDVGGQRGERRKWIQVFDRSTAILFLVDIGSFDTTLREEPTKNRLLESLKIFDQVWNNRYLRNVSIILFLNKIDVLTEKVKRGKKLQDYINLILEELQDEIETGCDENYQARLSEYQELFKNYANFDYKQQGKKRKSSIIKTVKKHIQNEQMFLDNHPWKDEVPDEAIRMAEFVKDIFMRVAKEKRKTESGENWHENHSCEYFYTCAIDTDNIRNVLEGCRTIIIKEHLRRLSISVG
uniref:Guanine nucleotide-binding protein G(s) subunit alpha n=1 Tax=Terebratalia transversa TaxID=34513 RepID=M9UWA1_TERTR|nr:G protein subunit alpha s2 [Terebratalia transversa]